MSYHLKNEAFKSKVPKYFKLDYLVCTFYVLKNLGYETLAITSKHWEPFYTEWLYHSELKHCCNFKMSIYLFRKDLGT